MGICNGIGDLYWDPLAEEDWRPLNNPNHPDYDRHGRYFSLRGFQDVGYSMWVLAYTTETAAYYNKNPFDYTHSGNPPEPYNPHFPDRLSRW